ncbi:xanthine dehydrogenase family protein subunit M [Nocardiopsis sp. MG754419]|uniref:FAD binding domain-containing protein n=1 Tax=Nocardiopsis sp. MG754419 TaxID=2259865 RepID=UPI001BA86E72|nr:FAD binding domain-containing protein [Nocardiopsis sp. MG754419]MBR8742389.1 oxidoreductase [Nocardiopsis sp. MG754419]
MTVTRPTSVAEVTADLAREGVRARAGGTDLSACLETGVIAPGPLVDLLDVPGLDGVTWNADGSARVGAMTTVATVAADPRLATAYPALAATARALATPQVRGVATVGGNLLQRNRCAYLRNPAFDCFQTGGDTCPARTGDHLRGVVVDQGPCAAPHPSSLAMAFLVYEATAHLERASATALPVADLYDGTDPTRDHVLDARSLMTAVELPVPVAGERAAYRRATGRSRAEWPLVEAVVRVECADGGRGPVERAAVAVGGVARTPLRLEALAETLVGAEPGRDLPVRVTEALSDLADLCSPLPATGYKVPLLQGTVRDVVETVLGITGR